MKQLKFLMVAFTLLMGVSFTSCLNDDAGESMYDGIGYVRTVMGSYFVDLYGNTYHPTMASVTEMEAQGFKMSGTDLAQIAFKYVEDTPATKAEGSTFTPQDYRIKLVSAIAVDSYSTLKSATKLFIGQHHGFVAISLCKKPLILFFSLSRNFFAVGFQVSDKNQMARLISLFCLFFLFAVPQLCSQFRKDRIEQQIQCCKAKRFSWNQNCFNREFQHLIEQQIQVLIGQVNQNYCNHAGGYFHQIPSCLFCTRNVAIGVV